MDWDLLEARSCAVGGNQKHAGVAYFCRIWSHLGVTLPRFERRSAGVMRWNHVFFHLLNIISLWNDLSTVWANECWSDALKPRVFSIFSTLSLWRDLSTVWAEECWKWCPETKRFFHTFFPFVDWHHTEIATLCCNQGWQSDIQIHGKWVWASSCRHEEAMEEPHQEARGGKEGWRKQLSLQPRGRGWDMMRSGQP